MLTRRRLAAALAASPALRAVSTILLGLTDIPLIYGTAQAEPITIAIALAAAVAGLIAANNRGDGGLGAFLEAIKGELNVVSDQIASLQVAVASVLAALSTLQSDFENTLAEHDVKSLHDEIRASIISYQTLIDRRRQNYTSDVDFRANASNIHDIRAVIDRLEKATSTIIAKKSFGPSTALVLPGAFLLDHSLHLLRGDDPRDVAVGLKRYYIILDGAVDPLLTSSTAFYRAQATLRHNNLWLSASETDFGKKTKMQAGSYMLVCSGINTYTHYDGREVPCHNDPQGPGGRGPYRGILTPNSSRYFPVSYSKEEIANTCYILARDVQGPHERLVKSVSFSEKEYIVDTLIDGKQFKESAGFMQVDIQEPEDKSLPPVSAEGDTSLPADCEVHSSSTVQDASTRRNILITFLKDSSKQKDFNNFSSLVATINQERARIAYATNSLTIFAKSRSQLDSLISGLNG